MSLCDHFASCPSESALGNWQTTIFFQGFFPLGVRNKWSFFFEGFLWPKLSLKDSKSMIIFIKTHTEKISCSEHMHRYKVIANLSHLWRWGAQDALLSPFPASSLALLPKSDPLISSRKETNRLNRKMENMTALQRRSQRVLITFSCISGWCEEVIVHLYIK